MPLFSGISVPAKRYAYVKLRYTAPFTLSPTGTGTAVYQFRLNDIYDPDKTGTGGQPLYRDQMFLFYSYAQVYGCKVNIQSVGNASNVNVLMRPSSSVTAPTSYQTEEQRPDKIRWIVTAGGPAVTRKAYYSVPSLFGLTKANYLGEATYYNSISSGPSGGTTATAVLNIMAADPALTATVSVNCRIELTYYCRFTERIPMAAS